MTVYDSFGQSNPPNSQQTIATTTNSNSNQCSSEGSAVDEGVKLKQNLGLLNGIAIIFGIIVGSGIFISPIGVLEEVGSVGASLIVWVACGVLSTVGALCYAELGTSIPKSGGDFAYIMEGLGEFPAFLFIWGALFIIMPAGNAIAGLTFAQYVIKPFYPNCVPPTLPLQLVAGASICLLTFINCYSVKWATFVQDTFTTAKSLALAIIIGAGFYQLVASDGAENFKNPWQGMTTSPSHFATAFYSGLFSYAGWNYLNFIVEELKNPYKNLPRAIYVSLPAVTIVYVLTNVAYFAVLTQGEFLSSPSVAVTFGDKILGVMSWIMPVSVAFSTFGGLNGCIFASSRLFFVGARAGHLPSFLAMVNVNYYTPIPALIFLGILSCSYLCVTQIKALIEYTAFIESLFTTFSVAALLYLRWKRPDMERPIKVNIILPILFFIVCTFLVVLPFYSNPRNAGYGVLIASLGIPIYFVTVYWKSKPDWYHAIIAMITRFFQKFFLCVAEEV